MTDNHFRFNFMHEPWIVLQIYDTGSGSGIFCHTYVAGANAWCLSLIALAMLIVPVHARLTRHKLPLNTCPACGYDLRAHHPGDKCPECGTTIEKAPR